MFKILWFSKLWLDRLERLEGRIFNENALNIKILKK